MTQQDPAGTRRSRSAARRADRNVNRRAILMSAGIGTAAAAAAGVIRLNEKPLTDEIPAVGPLPKGDLLSWRQVVAEDFEDDVPLGEFRTDERGRLLQGSTAHRKYASRLGGYPDGWPTTEDRGIYRPSETVSIQNSVLDIHLHRDARTGVPLSAAILPWREDTASDVWRYGRWSSQMRAVDVGGPGWWGLNLLWPETDGAWPESGEVDWPEGDLSEPIKGWNHPPAKTLRQQPLPGTGTWSDWHTFTLEWLPSGLRFYQDGLLTYRLPAQDAPTTPMRWIVQSETNKEGLPGDTSARLQVAWVAGYRMR